MSFFVIVIHIITAVFLILTVLLQTGKGGGLGSAFGGSSGNLFGSRGPATFIAKLTWLAAVVFMVTSLTMATSYKRSSEDVSIMESAVKEELTLPIASGSEDNPFLNNEEVIPNEPNANEVSKNEIKAEQANTSEVATEEKVTEEKVTEEKTTEEKVTDEKVTKPSKETK